MIRKSTLHFVIYGGMQILVCFAIFALSLEPAFTQQGDDRGVQPGEEPSNMDGNSAGDELPNLNPIMDPSLASTEDDSLFAGFMDPYEYDPRGRRDPFVQPLDEMPVVPGDPQGPVLPLQRFDLTELRLVGILWDVRNPRAMIRDPEGQTHVVGVNAKLGQRHGYVASIREGEIIVVETIEQDGELVPTSQVVKIAK